jgi:diamine N-acetyltransferase
MKNIGLYLKVPGKDELEYRIKLISDPDTMSFNRGYGDDGTGVYNVTREQAENWYKRRTGVPGEFYAYIARLLAGYAFNEMGLDKIADRFPKDRTAADRIFAKVGFVRQDNDLLVLTKSDFENITISSVSHAPIG